MGSIYGSLIENLHYPHEYGSEWVPVVARRKQYPSDKNLIRNVINTFANKMTIEIKVEYALSYIMRQSSSLRYLLTPDEFSSLYKRYY